VLRKGERTSSASTSRQSGHPLPRLSADGKETASLVRKAKVIGENGIGWSSELKKWEDEVYLKVITSTRRLLTGTGDAKPISWR